MGPVHVLSRHGTTVGKGLLWPRAHGSLEQTRMSLVVGSSAVPPSWPVTKVKGHSQQAPCECGDLE